MIFLKVEDNLLEKIQVFPHEEILSCFRVIVRQYFKQQTGLSESSNNAYFNKL